MKVKAFVLVGGEHDEAFLKRALPKQLLKNTKIVVGGNALSLGVSLLVARQIPVALLVDADTGDDGGKDVKQQERLLRGELQHFSPGLPFEVVMAVPNLATVLFGEHAEGFEKKEMQQKIDELDIRQFQDHPIVVKLVQFLDSVVHHQDAVSY